MAASVRLSIVIPTRDRQHLLPRAITSALSECVEGEEIVVVRDREGRAVLPHDLLPEPPQLRVIRSDGPSGASGTRNAGVAAAAGSHVAFLDDDDEYLPGALERVRRAASTGASWGFAQRLMRTGRTDDWYITPDRTRITASGLLGRKVPFRHKIAPLSTGFWILRSLFQDLGGLSTALRIDEDTNLCCRLLAAGHPPWFEIEPAVIFDHTVDSTSLTRGRPYDLQVECYLRTLRNNIGPLASERGAGSFLVLRTQRAILRSGRRDLEDAFVAAISTRRLRFLAAARRLVWRVAGR